ncbi:MAG: AAA family ATPase, partial [Chromatiales bacterium]|nr:AAA family ATPase [Chromatiales bacterium]
RQLDRHEFKAGPDVGLALAGEFEATPAGAAGATAAARLGGGDIAAVRRGVRSLSRVLACERPPQGTPVRFDPGLVNADTDPAVLAERLAGLGERRFSLCLQGPPGTGKSAFVRYLAERLGLEVIQKRASDLMSMWVGETEQRIAAAFAEARDTGAFLVFDEADSLLADRRFAHRSWEVSQVNEMLTWMESHPLPFACTTNFGEHLDPATLRRFVFKVTLDYLSPAQAEAAFRGYFALTPPAEFAALTALTPGDFAVVRRKAEILDRLSEPESLAAMLRDECDAKPDRPRAIGFRP